MPVPDPAVPPSDPGPVGSPTTGSTEAPGPGPADRLRATAPGTRVVVRSRIVSGFTDTLGELRSCDGTVAVIDTRGGPAQVVVAHVVAMRIVPPPPPRRSQRVPPG
ncbi:ferrous iron transport protein A [Nakamurella flava]|uniref:putative acetyltransferase n=1 Tax=Nakamurella flava TaxID=2576308 RepID=UPI001F0DC71A|nr:ferrous iron transport protein A [Nakamurella flava]